jgi:preprotein translocase subunit SecY
MQSQQRVIPSETSTGTTLFRRVGFVIAALLVYHLGRYVPLVGIDYTFLYTLQGDNPLLKAAYTSIFGLGIEPYITASLLMQALIWIVPSLARRVQSYRGRLEINQYIRILTALLAAIQGYAIANAMLPFLNTPRQSFLLISVPLFQITTIATFTAGTMYLLWLSDQITKRGLGDGVLLILFAGVIAKLPNDIAIPLLTAHIAPKVLYMYALVVFCIIGAMVFIEQARRRIFVRLPEAGVAGKMSPGGIPYLQLKLNPTGIIAPFFAVWLVGASLYFIALWKGVEVSSLLYNTAGQPLTYVAASLGIVFFALYYTATMLNTRETVAHLEKSGGIIEDLPPGTTPVAYIGDVQMRIAVAGVVYLVLVYMVPEVLVLLSGVPFYIGGFSLLIIVLAILNFLRGVAPHLLKEPQPAEE